MKQVSSHDRGHKIFFDGKEWRYSDNNKIVDHNRPCSKCGLPPTKEGYDYCLGHIEGVTSACCGHGIDDPIRMFK